MKSVFRFRLDTPAVKHVRETVLKKPDLPAAKERLKRRENLISGQLWWQPRRFNKETISEKMHMGEGKVCHSGHNEDCRKLVCMRLKAMTSF